MSYLGKLLDEKDGPDSITILCNENMFSNRGKIHIIEPKSYQKIDTEFVIYGLVPKSWFSESGVSSLCLDLLDIEGQIFHGGLNISISNIKSTSKDRRYGGQIFLFSTNYLREVHR